jgi:hypothetical protein
MFSQFVLIVDILLQISTTILTKPNFSVSLCKKKSKIPKIQWNIQQLLGLNLPFDII